MASAAPGAVRERRPGRPDRVPEVKWLAECSAAALREALEAVAPELSGYPVTVPGPAGKQDPLYHGGSEPLGDRFIVKFAWSRPAALRLAKETGVLTAGLPLNDHRTPPEWVEDLATRFSGLGIDPETPPAASQR
jgi:hypothetical protein